MTVSKAEQPNQSEDPLAGAGTLNRPGMCPAVLTAKPMSGVTVLSIPASEKMRPFAASWCGQIWSGSLPPLPRTTDKRRRVMSSGTSSSADPAAERRPGGRRWKLFLGRRDVKGDDSWQMRRDWRPLVLSDDGGLSLTVMLISVLSCVSATRAGAAWIPEVVWPQKDRKKGIFLFLVFSPCFTLARGNWTLVAAGSSSL